MTDNQILDLAKSRGYSNYDYEGEDGTAFLRGYRSCENANAEILFHLKSLIDVIEIHETSTDNCNGTDENYCDCLDRQLEKAKRLLKERNML